MLFADALEEIAENAFFVSAGVRVNRGRISLRRASPFAVRLLYMDIIAPYVSACTASVFPRLFAAIPVTTAVFPSTAPVSSSIPNLYGASSVFVTEPLTEPACNTVNFSSGSKFLAMTCEPSMLASPLTLIVPALPPATPCNMPSESRLPVIFMEDALLSAPAVPLLMKKPLSVLSSLETKSAAALLLMSWTL